MLAWRAVVVCGLWPVHITSIWDDPPLRMQNVQWGMSCVIRSGVLFKPHVIDVHIIQFRPKEVGNHRPMSRCKLSLSNCGKNNVLIICTYRFAVTVTATPSSSKEKRRITCCLETLYSHIRRMERFLMKLSWDFFRPVSTILLVDCSIYGGQELWGNLSRQFRFNSCTHTIL